MSSQPPPQSVRGRGAAANPANRFEPITYLPELDESESSERPPATQVYKDATRSFITYNESPDVGFDASINPYRG